MAIHWLTKETQHLTQYLQTAAIAERVRHLGAHGTTERAVLGFWSPALVTQAVSELQLELFRPCAPFDPALRQQCAEFKRYRLPITQHGEWLWGVYAGLHPGQRQQVGDLYWVRYRTAAGKWAYLSDPFAYSQPFGLHAPAEYYDIAALFAQRGDSAYFQQAAHWQRPINGYSRPHSPCHILQLHVSTATEDGTLASLTAFYQQLAEKQAKNRAFSAFETNFLGYEALQLLPIEPVAEAAPSGWQVIHDPDPAATTTTVRLQLRRPYNQNWGYDTVISGMASVNTALLATGRPDELLEFIVTLHTFPQQPMRLILDIVLGHAHTQASQRLDPIYFAHHGVYGLGLNQRQPIVRAILLELLRRKLQWGIDGFRVDASHDIGGWTDNQWHYDDDFLQAMSALTTEVSGRQYQPWMVFEDGRPTGGDDWPLTADYHAVIARQPAVYQWGPLTFAKNSPCYSTFWLDKQWQVQALATQGEQWVHGVGNHDTLRRLAQLPVNEAINWRLGRDLVEVFHNAYDHPAALLLAHTFLPGIPHDFLAVTCRSPWTFFRNLDGAGLIALVAAEAMAFPWLVNAQRFQQAAFFPRLKALGFDYPTLKTGMEALAQLGPVAQYQVEPLCNLLHSLAIPFPAQPLTQGKQLQQFARAWMADIHAYCKVTAHQAQLNPTRTAFYYQLRQFRSQRPWLRDNLRPSLEQLAFLQPSNGRALYYGWRHSPDDTEQLFLIAHLAGEPITLKPLSLLSDLPIKGWSVALTTPGLTLNNAADTVTVSDSEAVLLQRCVSELV